MVELDPLLSLCLCLQANKGAYALLLGSGLSSAAGIPTGWAVVGDLAQKIALLREEACGADPIGWYTRTFGREPDYSEIVGQVAPSPSERTALLRSYFEPTAEERERGLKVPTAAHRAIADLVARGFVRVIITTNFDRLMEAALEAVGVTPTLIATEDAVQGALPLIHTQCTVIKVNGDYVDTRIRNTRGELSQYGGHLASLLDRVLDDFGLLVCGWSARWDVALSDAIRRCGTRRFTTFWCLRGEADPVAVDLINHRQAKILMIDTADRFFQDVRDKLAALEDLARPHPLSVDVAVATVKRYLVDPAQRIRLHDLVFDEVERIYRSVPSLRIPASRQAADWVRNVEALEGLTEVLRAMFGVGSYWGDTDHIPLWTGALERIANLPDPSGLHLPGIDLGRYPALLVAYAGGVASLAAGRYDTLVALLMKPQVGDDGDVVPLVRRLNAHSVLDSNSVVQIFGGAKRYTPISDRVYDLIRGSLRFVIKDADEFDCNFDKLEYLIALVWADIRERSIRGNWWGPPGRFAWRRPGPRGSIMERVETEARDAGQGWGPIALGLFGGSLDRFFEVKHALDAVVESAHWH